MMTKDEFEATLTIARKFGGFGLDPYFRAWLDHDAEQRAMIEQQAQQIARLGSRSHPHEDMNQICELRTEVARLKNELSQRTNLEGSAPCWNSAHMKQIATLREALEACLAQIQNDIKECGPCEHDVNICVCPLKILAAEAQQALKE